MTARSPFAPGRVDDLPPISGVELASVSAGLRYKNRPDLLLAAFPQGARVAGLYTRSACPSAAIEWCRDITPAGNAFGLVVNAGNANAFTGRRGADACRMTARFAAEALRCEPAQILLASTGVIGEPLDPAPFEALLGRMVGETADTGWDEAARAIGTTDTYPKLVSREALVEGQRVRVNGIAKGSGMIAPDMATMLAFLFTDAPVGARALQAILAAHVESTFNAITVDGDTSTSDAVLAFATGGGEIDEPGDRRLGALSAAFRDAMGDLALQIVKDGEGISKLMRITVNGAKTDGSAKRIALSIANSPLVKTAVAGEDANWGRVVMAVGKAGEPADRDRLEIWFGPHRVAHRGERDPSYDEDVVSRYMRGREIAIDVNLGLGEGRFGALGSDLTHAYVSINADYRS